FAVEGKSRFYQSGIYGTFEGQKKTIFSRDEAIEVLQSLEKQWEKEGYGASSKQPFKSHIYTLKKGPSPVPLAFLKPPV
ncbi:MAG: hypothetical protein HY052_01335, partial [Proteobacteria bacterium]|nr:hypothetical protein [Pseudomonadota bacterium]